MSKEYADWAKAVEDQLAPTLRQKAHDESLNHVEWMMGQQLRVIRGDLSPMERIVSDLLGMSVTRLSTESGKAEGFNDQ